MRRSMCQNSDDRRQQVHPRAAFIGKYTVLLVNQQKPALPAY